MIGKRRKFADKQMGMIVIILTKSTMIMEQKVAVLLLLGKWVIKTIKCLRKSELEAAEVVMVE